MPSRKYGWCTAIRGAEGGGKVEGLPASSSSVTMATRTSSARPRSASPIAARPSSTSWGSLPLCHYKNTDYAVFFGSQTAQKPKKYDRPEATSNAVISARLTYIMAASRFAHYIKVMARDKIGSFAEATDVEHQLQRWILNYVNANPAVVRPSRPGIHSPRPRFRSARSPADRVPTMQSSGSGPGCNSRS